MGCKRSRSCRNRSAGGQLEQPSEVNSSTNTGDATGISASAATMGDTLACANNTHIRTSGNENFPITRLDGGAGEKLQSIGRGAAINLHFTPAGALRRANLLRYREEEVIGKSVPDGPLREKLRIPELWSVQFLSVRSRCSALARTCGASTGRRRRRKVPHHHSRTQ